jgi:hypothetical protein
VVGLRREDRGAPTVREGTAKKHVPTTGLYYPFIHFKDDGWLKLTALYWDKMARIVPSSYRRVGGSRIVLERDSYVTRELAEIDFIRNVSPSEVTYPVSLLWQQLLSRHAADLRTEYDVAKRDTWEPDPATAAYAQHRDPRLAYVHSSKLDEALVRQLQSESLAMAHNEGGEIWAGVHPRLAAVYMSALAEEVATANGHHPLTDETLDHVAATGWSLPRLAAALLGRPAIADDATLLGPEADASRGIHDELNASLALVSIRTVVPKDVSALSVRTIDEIRQRFGEELTRLQKFIDGLAADLPQLTEQADPTTIVDHVQLTHDKEIKPLVDDLGSQLRSAGIDTALSAMSTSVAMPAALALLPAGPVVSVGAVALSVIPVVRAKRRQGREAYERSPVAYLYRLEDGLKPDTMLKRVRQRIRQFLTGV